MTLLIVNLNYFLSYVSDNSTFGLMGWIPIYVMFCNPEREYMTLFQMK